MAIEAERLREEAERLREESEAARDAVRLRHEMEEKLRRAEHDRQVRASAAIYLPTRHAAMASRRWRRVDGV